MNIINKIKNKFLYLIISKQLKFKQKVLSEGLNLKKHLIDTTYDNFLDSKKFLVAISLFLSLIIITKNYSAKEVTLDLASIFHIVIYLFYALIILCFLLFILNHLFLKIGFLKFLYNTFDLTKIFSLSNANKAYLIFRIAVHFMFVLTLPFIVYKLYVIFAVDQSININNLLFLEFVNIVDFVYKLCLVESFHLEGIPESRTNFDVYVKEQVSNVMKMLSNNLGSKVTSIVISTAKTITSYTRDAGGAASSQYINDLFDQENHKDSMDKILYENKKSSTSFKFQDLCKRMSVYNPFRLEKTNFLINEHFNYKKPRIKNDPLFVKEYKVPVLEYSIQMKILENENLSKELHPYSDISSVVENSYNNETSLLDVKNLLTNGTDIVVLNYKFSSLNPDYMYANEEISLRISEVYKKHPIILQLSPKDSSFVILSCQTNSAMFLVDKLYAPEDRFNKNSVFATNNIIPTHSDYAPQCQGISKDDLFYTTKLGSDKIYSSANIPIGMAKIEDLDKIIFVEKGGIEKAKIRQKENYNKISAFSDTNNLIINSSNLSEYILNLQRDSLSQRLIEQNGNVELSTKNHVCNVQNLPLDEISSTTGNKRVNLLKNIPDVSYITNNKFILDGGNPFLNANSEQK